jgi:acetylornithine deacetylase/succinyl-diaminopimelate desuccinylase-like protein
MSGERIMADLSEDRVFDLLGELVRRPSPSGREGDLAAFVADWLRSEGIDANLSDAAPARPNMVARLSRGGGGGTLLLFGHTDTALAADGWDTDPYVLHHRDGVALGLGAADMKGGLAAMMLAARELARRDTWQGTVILAGVIDEEAYSTGMKDLLGSLPRPDWGLLAEPHFDDPVLGCPGKVLLRVHVHGQAAHASTPAAGINAITEAARLLTAIEALPLATHPALGTGSQCVLTIRGGPDAYVITVPEHCEFVINRHVVPGETAEQVVAQVRDTVQRLNLRARAQVSIDDPYYPPYTVSATDPLVRAFSTVYQDVTGVRPRFGYSHGVCDANYLVADAGVPTVVFGPRGGNVHAPNEWVDLSSVAGAAAVFVRMAEALMPRASRATQ